MARVLFRFCETYLKPSLLHCEVFNTQGFRGAHKKQEPVHEVADTISELKSCGAHKKQEPVHEVADTISELKSGYDCANKYPMHEPVLFFRPTRSSSKIDALTSLLVSVLPVSKAYVQNEYNKRSQLRYVTVSQVSKTLSFLHKIGFKKDVIAETLCICFYPRKKVIYGMLKVEENKEQLAKCKIRGGFISEGPRRFRCGKTSTDKRLELCLYYIEKDSYFQNM